MSFKNKVKCLYNEKRCRLFFWGEKSLLTNHKCKISSMGDVKHLTGGKCNKTQSLRKVYVGFKITKKKFLYICETLRKIKIVFSFFFFIFNRCINFLIGVNHILTLDISIT